MSAKHFLTLSLCLVLGLGCFAQTTMAVNVLYVGTDTDQGTIDNDNIVQDRIKGFGHTVVYFAGNGSENNEGPLRAACMDPSIEVVYFSETLGSSDIKTTVSDIDVPMICAEPWAWEPMGLITGADGADEVTTTNITIVAEGHFLAAGLVGEVEVLTSINFVGAQVARFSRGTVGGEGTAIATWNHGGEVRDVLMVYDKGAMLAKVPGRSGSDIFAANIRIGLGMYDERAFPILNDAAFSLLDAAINYSVGDREAAVVLNPADGATDIARQSVLQWIAGESAETHDVYFGMDFSDVNEASTSDPRNVLQAQGQEPNAFDPGLLAYGTTYYWRVDEVGAAPDNALTKGTVWSFTAEPFSVAVPSIVASASSQQSPDLGPENTINGSGLDEAGLHGTLGETMWLSATGDPAVWIQYAFDRPYKLDKMLVWNSNQAVESFIGLGAKEVTLEVSTNGTDWTVVENVSEFAQAPGAAGYAANTTVDFGGASAQHVRISVNSGYGPLGQFGLSEVQIFYIPTFAGQPNPESGAVDVDPEVTLSWGRDGREAGSHDVYLGSTPDDLTLAGTVMESSLDTVALDLHLGETYSWRVDEVNEAMDPSTWTGDVWSFSTVDAIGVDDMEGYKDEEFFEIWATWVDGFGDPSNGSEVGANPAIGDFSPETGLVHGGGQSLPLNYDNSAAAQSEAKRTFDAPMDWIGHGVQGLVLFFQGSDTNTGGSLYVKINDTKVAYDGDPAALMVGGWTEWTISLADVAGDLSAVTSLTIGVDGGGMGVVYVDDIQLRGGAGQ